MAKIRVLFEEYLDGEGQTLDMRFSDTGELQEAYRLERQLSSAALLGAAGSVAASVFMPGFAPVAMYLGLEGVLRRKTGHGLAAAIRYPIETLEYFHPGNTEPKYNPDRII